MKPSDLLNAQPIPTIHTQLERLMYEHVFHDGITNTLVCLNNAFLRYVRENVNLESAGVNYNKVIVMWATLYEQINIAASMES